MNICKVSMLLFLLLPEVIFAATPEWVKNKPNRNSSYYYYVGRASNSRTESEGFSSAYRNAVEQAIREQFGVITNINSEAYFTQDENLFTEKSSERSPRVNIKGFELQESYTQKNGRKNYDVWLLYKYPISEIEKEKIRLEAGINSKIVFIDAGSVADNAKQTVEIVTDPSGAEVYVNGKLLMGETPLKVKLASGPNIIQIEHANYKTISEQLISVGTEHKRLNYILSPARGYLNIKTTPNNARVFINGKPVGLTPLKEYPLNVGEEHLIRLDHHEAEKYTQTITLEKDEYRDIEQNLPLKPAKILVTTEPIEGVEIYIDDELKGKTPKRNHISVSAGQHFLRLSKNGYLDSEFSMELKGNEYRVLKPIKLEKLCSLDVKTSPSGASVYIDGVYEGRSPLVNKELSCSNHRLKIEKKGYYSHSERVTFKKKQLVLKKNIDLNVLPMWTKNKWEGFIGIFPSIAIRDKMPNNLADYFSFQINFNLGVEYKLLSFVSLRTALIVGFGNSGDAASKTSLGGEFGLPLYLSSIFGSKENVVVFTPLVGQQFDFISFDYGNAFNSIDLSQWFYGYQLEYRAYWYKNKNEEESRKGIGFGLAARTFSEKLTTLSFLITYYGSL